MKYARPLVAGITLLSGIAAEAPMAQAAEQDRICVDAQGGEIDSQDPINTKGIQAAVGAYVDGDFGPQTCGLVWNELIEKGHLSGDGKTLKIGSIVHGWLDVEMPTANTPQPASQPTKTNECPTKVESAVQISPYCRSVALTALRDMGFIDDDTRRAVKAFQIEAGVVAAGGFGFGNFGPLTYTSVMSGAGEQTIESRRPFNNGYIVDISDQTILHFKNGNLVMGSLVSTGKEGRETRLGTFTFYLYRKDWKDGWVRSSLQTPNADPAMYLPIGFSGSRTGTQAIHGTRHESKLGTPASSGCIRTPDEVQDYIVADNPVGEKLLVQA